VLTARQLTVRYGAVVAVGGVDLDLHRGEVTALMGRNGSGKSSLLWALHGRGARSSGTVVVDAAPGPGPGGHRPVALVPQSPTDLLFLQSVEGECRLADRESGRPAGTCAALLERIVPGIDPAAHPRDLSEGQRLAVALAVQLCPQPAVLLLDEPTRGLDEHAKARFARVIADEAARGTAVVVATHDVEFVARAATRVVVLADGEVVADGPTADVVVSSPVFAPQVAKVLYPQHWLTVDQVAAALGAAR
jgi:energy-coupling factor transport system ATP-binding protein